MDKQREFGLPIFPPEYFKVNEAASIPLAEQPKVSAPAGPRVSSAWSSASISTRP